MGGGDGPSAPRLNTKAASQRRCLHLVGPSRELRGLSHTPSGRLGMYHPIAHKPPSESHRSLPKREDSQGLCPEGLSLCPSDWKKDPAQTPSMPLMAQVMLHPCGSHVCRQRVSLQRTPKGADHLSQDLLVHHTGVTGIVSSCSWVISVTSRLYMHLSLPLLESIYSFPSKPFF